MVQLPGSVIFDQCELGWEALTVVLVHEGQLFCLAEKLFDRLHGSCARVLRPVCGGDRWMLGEDGEIAAGGGLRCHLKKVLSLGRSSEVSDRFSKFVRFRTSTDGYIWVHPSTPALARSLS
jgi:hypothetical protein